MENIDLDRRQSLVVDAMRFPLITLVVFSHIIADGRALDFINYPFTQNLYYFITFLFSRLLGHIPVCCFFVFSGYYFFYKQDKLSLELYKIRLSKRITSLLIPFFIWNIIFLIVIFIKLHLFDLVGLDNRNEADLLHHSLLFEHLWTNPINFPLWFMRDLFCISLLSPIVYYFLKTFKNWGLLIVIAAYVLLPEVSNIGVPGLGFRAVVFFSIGAYFSINKQNMLEFFLKKTTLVISLIISLVMIVVCTMKIGTSDLEMYRRFFSFFGMGAFFFIADYLFSKFDSIKEFCLERKPMVFLIYVLHPIYILFWVRALTINRGFLSKYYSGKIFGYFITPIITILIIIFIYRLWLNIFRNHIEFYPVVEINIK